MRSKGLNILILVVGDGRENCPWWRSGLSRAENSSTSSGWEKEHLSKDEYEGLQGQGLVTLNMSVRLYLVPHPAQHPQDYGHT